jgi:ADP-ribosylglycohydrolase
MPRVDPDKAVGALLGLAAAGDPQMALRLASSVIEVGGYDPRRVSYEDATSAVSRTTPIGIAFAGRDEALRDATLADAALTDSEPLSGKVALLHNQVVAWSLTGGPDLVFHYLKDPEWLDDRIEDVVIPATSGVLSYATSLAHSEPESPLAAIAVALAAFFNTDGFDPGLEWATSLLGANAAPAGALLGVRFGAPAQGREHVADLARRLAAMAG